MNHSRRLSPSDLNGWPRDGTHPICNRGKWNDIYKGTGAAAHGPRGMSLLFVDGHSEFALYDRLNAPFKEGAKLIYNLDWTVGGLAGEDLK